MKKLLLAAALVVAGAGNCLAQEYNHVTVSPLSKDVNIQAGDNGGAFDVNALASIVQKSTDPSVLEQQINDPANNIDNLDLDKDGNIDFLTVTETSGNVIEIHDAALSPSVLIARLTMTPENGNGVSSNNAATLQIDGTPAYCGPYYYYYRPHISFGTMLFMAYLLRPHAYYVPMWGYRHYPHYYTSHYTSVRTVYRPSRSAYTPVQRGYRNRQSLSRPSSSQRSFNARSSRYVGSGGFGNNHSRSSGGVSNSRNSRSFGNGSSSRSYGGGHSSSRGFGGSRGSSRSFGGGHSSSRSFGGGHSSSRSSGRSFGRRR